MVKPRRLLILCSSALVFTIFISQSVNAQTLPSPPNQTVQQLEQIFGTPQEFIANFDESIKDKSDGVIGLLVAAFGFSIVIKTFL